MVLILVFYMCEHPNFPSPFVEDAVFLQCVFLQCVFLASLSNLRQLLIMCSHFWVFYFIPLTYMSVFEPMTCDFSYYSSVIELEVWYKNPSSVPCPSCFDCFGVFCDSYVICRISLFLLCEECYVYFCWACIKFVNDFWQDGYFYNFYGCMHMGGLSFQCLPQFLSSTKVFTVEMFQLLRFIHSVVIGTVFSPGCFW